ncbi:F23F12.8 [Symbiodinium natans]|uniref:F23F12.8 protein n=1 Tax=Symbiodinium natans TaxID=878477 RepID=A0A812SWU4_9DINO|nr:F23F12.8 [Symbiodinium natans]
MREQFSGLETKRCCEEKTEAACLSCCQQHFASRGDKCVDVCSTMCSFGWNAANQKVPQCPEKLGSEEGGAEEWYTEDPMKDRPRPAVPVARPNRDGMTLGIA